MSLDKLRLHSLVMPALQAATERDEEFEHVLYDVRGATVFDCRSLDPGFLDDTGAAAIHEAEALESIVRLPFTACYFEFSDELGILATEIDHWEGELEEVPVGDAVHFSEVLACGKEMALGYREGPKSLGTAVEVRSYDTYPNKDDEFDLGPLPVDEYVQEYADSLMNVWGTFNNKTDILEDGGPEFFTESGFVPYVDNPIAHLKTREHATRLLGVLTLLNDHLLATEVLPDPAPKLNRAREKKGRLPVSGERRVLTINTAAVRRASRGTVLRAHESPRLHWRRGHWRVLHRHSEFESKTWVRRCLVGDPDRGFVHKDYRVVWEQPMLEAPR